MRSGPAILSIVGVYLILTVSVINPSLFAREIQMLYMAQAGYQPSDIQQRARSFTAATGVSVNLVFAEYEDQYNLIMESAARPVGDYDIILLDLIWTADFAERSIIDPIPDYLAETVKEGIVPEIHTAFQFQDRLWAVPFLANFQLLYTNMNLLEEAGFTHPPETLEELVFMAEKARDEGVVKFPIFLSLRKQEVLVCEFVWLAGAFGGDLTDIDGMIDVASSGSVQALSFLVDLLDRGLLNPYSLQSEEVFSAEVFVWGDSLFSTNWTFLGRMIKESDTSIRTAGQASLIPGIRTEVNAGRITSTISGFQGLSVTRNSANKSDAWQFIQYLSSPEFQREHLEEMSVWYEVWIEENTLVKDPEIDLKRQQIMGVRHRPIHPHYRPISIRLQHWIYEALMGKVNPRKALENAQEEILRIIGERE